MTPAELRAARVAMGMTQAELAAEMGKTYWQISHQEAGRRSIDRVDAMAVCHLLLTRLKPRLKRWTLQRLIDAVSEGQPKG